MYSLAFYYMMSTPLEECPLLEKFVNGDDAYRNSRFKLIPYISKVSVQKQAVKMGDMTWTPLSLKNTICFFYICVCMILSSIFSNEYILLIYINELNLITTFNLYLRDHGL